MVAPLTRQYAAFLAATNEKTLPPGIAEIVRLGFTDCAAVILSGLKEPVVHTIKNYVLAEGAAPKSRYLFGTARTSAGGAAMINATAAHSLDFDDYAFSNHPSAVLVPTVLAAGEAVGASGARLVAGYAAGYEVWGDLMLREPDHLHAKGWHPTAVFGPVAAAAAACVVMGLNEHQALHALAMAASLAGGVMENFGTMAKPLHGGRAAQAGINAATMALAGIEASPTAIEGELGLMRALSPTGKVDLETPGTLGRDWRLLKYRLNIKKYPTVGASQRMIESLLALKKTHAIDPAKIALIEPRLSVRHYAVMPFHNADTGLRGKFSMQFIASCALLHGKVGLMQLKDEVVQSPAIRELMAKVKVFTTTETDPGYPGAAPFDFCRITMADGTVLESPPVARATGHADIPLPVEDIWNKFCDCAAYAGVAPDRAKALFDQMQKIDTVANANDVLAFA